jgi:hypothetical protein
MAFADASDAELADDSTSSPDESVQRRHVEPITESDSTMKDLDLKLTETTDEQNIILEPEASKDLRAEDVRQNIPGTLK